MKLVIQTNADFTPAGKRRARLVTFDRGVKRIVLYVSGRRYHMMAVTVENAKLANEWLAAA